MIENARPKGRARLSALPEISGLIQEMRDMNNFDGMLFKREYWIAINEQTGAEYFSAPVC